MGRVVDEQVCAACVGDRLNGAAACWRLTHKPKRARANPSVEVKTCLQRIRGGGVRLNPVF